METGGSGERTGEQQGKVDVRKLLAIVPPASELMKKERVLREKRVRVRYDGAVDKGVLKIPSELAKALGIKEGDSVELVVAGKKKFGFKALVFESADVNVVYSNPEVLAPSGVADNSIATVRRAQP